MKRTWSDEQLIEALKTSFSIAEINRKLRLKRSGSTSISIKKRIKELNLNSSHLLGQKTTKGRIGANKGKGAKLSEMLIEKSTYQRTWIKKKMLEEKNIENICHICRQKPEWNGIVLVMVLDHINGVNNDYRRENLRLLCPNCNSQQDTFCGKKNKRPKVIKKCGCGKTISNSSKSCFQCALITRKERHPDTYKSKIVWPSVSEIESMVDQNGYLKTGRLLGVSDNAVRQYLRRRTQ